MTALDESTQRPSERPLWRQGTLSDDEFEKAALAITPSWELGLDAASAAPLAAPPPTAVTGGAFAAPSAAVSSMLADAASEMGRPSLAPPAPTTTSRPPGVVPSEASMISAGAKTADAPTRRPVSMRPPVKRADDAYEAPRRAGNNNKIFAAIGGAMLLAGAIFVGFAGNSTSTPTPAPAPESAAPAPSTEPAPPVVEPAPAPPV
ncbi:MAG: hypothetical protein JWM10_5407, partial [Myxococcaceae bacterium]|nr:hypothetical protein [Myxococcaceae bacterium]